MIQIELKHKYITELTNLGAIIEENISLKPFTTWKVGGAAELFYRAKDEETLIKVMQYCKQEQIDVTVLGGGSNVLISDKGIAGLVIKNELVGISITNKAILKADTNNEIDNTEALNQLEARLIQVDKTNYYDFSTLDYQEEGLEKVAVEILSGTSLPLSINQTISQGITGLQWFAGIPGSIGGAVYNNIHGGSHFINEFIHSVKVINTLGDIQILTLEELRFDYDYSEFQANKYFILSVNFVLNKGDKDRALTTAIAWARAKSDKQPYNSAGCCFKNLTTNDQMSNNLESNSWGYIIDNVLKLKGRQIGGAQISTKHAAFIENKGDATAQDILDLLNVIYDTSKSQLKGLTPKTEIFFLGFDEVETKHFR